MERPPRLTRRVAARPSIFVAITLATIGFAMGCATLSQARSLRVPSAFATIDAGILAAQPGDTVLVAPGVYTGAGNRNIRLYGKAIVLISEGGPEQTIIDVQANYTEPARGFIIDGSETAETVIDGFTIIHGLMSVLPGSRDSTADAERSGPADQRHGSSSDGLDPVERIHGSRNGKLDSTERIHDLSGGGIRVTFQSHPTIRNMIVRNCHSDVTGGGVAIETDSAPNLIGCVIEDCTAGIQGGGVSIEFGGRPILERCVITGNRAARGGGVANDSNPFFGSPPHFIDCTIAGNFADDGGGGIYCFESSKVQLERVIVWGNCGGATAGELFVEPFAQASFACSLLDSSRVHAEGSIELAQDNLLDIAPGFCMPESCMAAPSDAGDYGVGDSSPCLAANSPCGARIGGIGPGACATPEPVSNTSWGRLKGILGKRRR